MTKRLATAVLASFALLGCGDEDGTAAPRLTDDLDWVLRVEFSEQHACTGMALSEHWLLTAAHCAREASDDQVEVSHHVFGDRRLVYQGSAELLVHPDYVEIGNLGHRWHDIALVGLGRPALEGSDRARIAGPKQTAATFWRGAASLYSVGYGHLPDPQSGDCSDELGSKKRYDGFALIDFLSPVFEDALGVKLDARDGALCEGDSGAPLIFDRFGIPQVFAVFGGEATQRSTFYGALTGPKLGWLEAATADTAAPLDCMEVGDDSWQCFE